MVEAMLIDLKALLVEREDCDAGTVQKLREALAQGGTQYRTLRDVTEVLKKKIEGVHRRGRQALAPQARHRLVLPRLHAAGRRASAPGRRRAGQLLPRPRPGLAPRIRRGAQGLRQGREGRLHRQPGAAAAGRHLPPEGRPGPRPLHPRQARRPGQPQRRVSLPARQLLPRRRRTAVRHRASGEGRKARPRPHRRPVPAGPRQRPRRQRRRGDRLLRALPEASAGPRRRR